MANKTFQTRVRSKRDTSARWTSNNPVLLDGEIIIVDTAEGDVRIKIGDGVKTYTQLPFVDESIRNLIPIVSDTYSETSSNAMSGKAVASAISGISGGGGTTIVVSTSQPTSLKDGDLWYAIV